MNENRIFSWAGAFIEEVSQETNSFDHIEQPTDIALEQEIAVQLWTSITQCTQEMFQTTLVKPNSIYVQEGPLAGLELRWTQQQEGVPHLTLVPPEGSTALWSGVVQRLSCQLGGAEQPMLLPTLYSLELTCVTPPSSNPSDADLSLEEEASEEEKESDDQTPQDEIEGIYQVDTAPNWVDQILTSLEEQSGLEASKREELRELLQQIAERVLVSLPTERNKDAVNITIKNTVFADTEIMMQRVQGEIHIQITSSSEESIQLLESQIDKLQQHLSERLPGEIIQVEVIATDGQSETGQQRDNRDPSRQRRNLFDELSDS